MMRQSGKKKSDPGHQRGALPAFGEGDICSLPVDNLGWTLAVIARGVCKLRGSILLMDFFDHVTPSCPESVDVQLGRRNAIATLLVSSLGLLCGKWKVVGKVVGFDRSDWPLPVFIRNTEYSPPTLVHYDENDLDAKDVRKTRADPSVFKGPVDRLCGYTSAEWHVARAIEATRSGTCRIGEYGWHIPPSTKSQRRR
jgi:hypothetical protein